MPVADWETFKLVVPLDATQVKDIDPKRPVKVAAFDREGSLYEATVRFDRGGRAAAVLTLDTPPKDMCVMVAPTNVTRSQLANPLPLCVEIPKKSWRGKRELTIPPIVISSFYWWWWLAPPLRGGAPPPSQDP